MTIPFYYYLFSLIILGLLLWRKKALSISLYYPYIFLVLAQTVFSRNPAEMTQIELMPFRYLFRDSSSGRDLLNQAMANIIMFIPIGFLSALNMKGYIWFFSICFPFVIELLQFFSHRGLCETDDVICNLLGELVGLIFYLNIRNKIKQIH